MAGAWLSKEECVIECARMELVYDSDVGSLGKDATPLQTLVLAEEDMTLFRCHDERLFNSESNYAYAFE